MMVTASRAEKLLREARCVLVCSHFRPDGDAISSLVALGWALDQLGKAHTLACPHPAPPNFHFLPGWEQITQELSPDSDYDLIIAKEQTQLHLDVSLLPNPGRVLVRSNHDGLKLLLGNFSSYLSGEENRRRMDLKPSSSQAEQELILSPGDYSLSAEYSSSIKEQIKFHLETDDTIELFIQFDSSTESLELKILE